MLDLTPLIEQSKAMPEQPGVYLFKSPSGVILYVGKAISLRKRTSSYFRAQGQDQAKVRSLTARAQTLDFILTDSEQQALLLESNLIKKHRPRYNILLRDDKSYPYLRLTAQEAFPRVMVSRRPLADGSKYYGPYPNLKVREIVKLMHRYFNLRDCDLDIPPEGPKVLERACLSYQIKQCPAPCIRAVDPPGYQPLVEKARWFLEGRHDELLERLAADMLKASERLEYEEAARLRDLKASIEQMQGGNTVLTAEKRNVDAIALAAGLSKVLVSVLQVRDGKLIESLALTLDNELEAPLPEVLPAFLDQFYGPGVFLPGEVLVPKEMELTGEAQLWADTRLKGKGKLHKPREDWQDQLASLAETNVLQALKEEIQKGTTLDDLQALLGLKRSPRVIACFDISTLQGKFTVGSAVLFRDGAPDKALYRKFRMKTVEGVDDYASHAEMMGRYLKLVERDGLPVPDLFLMDGGKGQLSTVLPILRDHFGEEVFGVAALAKREEEVFVPGHEAPVDFRGHLKTRHLLQRVRDEAHRFAVGYHRILREKTALTSLLQTVPGIGPQRLRALYRAFDSAQKVSEASEEELASVPGFSRALARKLKAYFEEKPGKASTDPARTSPDPPPTA